MNAKQSLKIVSARLADVETVLGRAQKDIKEYNACIDHMIAGGSPCDYCEDQRECTLQAKADGKGCNLWWLAYNRKDDADGAGNESERVFPIDSTSGREAQDPAGEITAF